MRNTPFPAISVVSGVVYVAVNGPERLESGNFVGERSRTDVACMPYFVYIRKEPLQGSIENSVRVRYDSYLFHPCKDKPAGRLPYPCGRFFYRAVLFGENSSATGSGRNDKIYLFNNTYQACDL